MAALAASLLWGAAPARAVDQSEGEPGFCTESTGVTVVIDFQDLNGTTLVRCYPSSSPGSGLDAIDGAGFQVTDTRRSSGFVCRIEDRPSADETIRTAGDGRYREDCDETPPSDAHWSYWHAGNNCAWTPSLKGIKNRDFVPGGFEGWSFSLDDDQGSEPAPRIAPVRPGSEGEPCSGGTAGTEALDPRQNVPFAGGEDAPDVAGQRSDRTSPTATIVVVVVVGLVALGALVSMRRRRR